MFSLKKIFRHDEKFFNLLEASAQQADSSVFSVLKWRPGLPPKSGGADDLVADRGFIFGAFTPHLVHAIFGQLQLASAAWMAHSHGSNDAQKTRGSAG